MLVPLVPIVLALPAALGAGQTDPEPGGAGGPGLALLAAKILTVPYEVPFIAISKAVFSHLANEQLELVTQALEVHERHGGREVRRRRGEEHLRRLDVAEEGRRQRQAAQHLQVFARQPLRLRSGKGRRRPEKAARARPVDGRVICQLVRP